METNTEFQRVTRIAKTREYPTTKGEMFYYGKTPLTVKHFEFLGNIFNSYVDFYMFLLSSEYMGEPRYGFQKDVDLNVICEEFSNSYDVSKIEKTTPNKIKHKGQFFESATQIAQIFSDDKIAVYDFSTNSKYYVEELDNSFKVIKKLDKFREKLNKFYENYVEIWEHKGLKYTIENFEDVENQPKVNDLVYYLGKVWYFKGNISDPFSGGFLLEMHDKQTKIQKIERLKKIVQIS